MLEPLGLLSGSDARLAIAAGQALPLAGGPLAFTMVRPPGGVAAAVASWCGSLDALTAPCLPWAGLPPGLLVMGIINVTPDSFSDGGNLFETGRAIEAGRRMLGEGASILDIGGESTRPGALPVAEAEERRRVLPIIEALARDGAVISVDTRNAATMTRALDAGATIVNDVSALQHDAASAAVIAARRCPVILMHMRGTPATMNGLAHYRDVAAEVLNELRARIAQAEAAGIERAAIAVDPGFGFAKNAAQSLELLQRLSLLVNLRCPIIAGLSRKRFIGALAGEMDARARGSASVAAGLAALSRGATILRVHDVAETVHAVRVWQAMGR